MKGSTVKRKVKITPETKPTTTLKDLNLKEMIARNEMDVIDIFPY